ncbi:MAG: hypothetical protein QXH37_01035 [Candidatus Bathyarchaeia archaeon]
MTFEKVNDTFMLMHFKNDERKNMYSYVIRNFTEGDEEGIVRLFNESFARFGGYVPRTVEYWRWCCLKRPDVRKNGILLAFNKETGDLEGYVVAGLSGNIWELCVKPYRKDVALILLEKAVNYLAEMGASAVNVNVPEDDEALNEACKEMGFAKVNVHKLFIGALSFGKLISMLACKVEKVTIANLRERVCIKINDAPFWVEETVSVRVEDAKIEVSEGLIESPTIQVKTNVKTLLAVLVGVLSPRRALLTLKIRVKPFWKILALNRFLCLLQMSDLWFWPLADFG